MGPVRQNPIQRTVSLFICVCIALCTIFPHNIAQNRPDSFPPYPPDNQHWSDDVYLREGGVQTAAFDISTAFNQSGWSNVMAGVGMFSCLAWWTTQHNHEYMQELSVGFMSITGNDTCHWLSSEHQYKLSACSQPSLAASCWYPWKTISGATKYPNEQVVATWPVPGVSVHLFQSLAHSADHIV